MNMEILPEDEEKIARLSEEIMGKSGAMTYDNFVIEKEKFEKNHLTCDTSNYKARKRKDRFYFYSKNEVGLALYLFFSDRYIAKHLAKNVYLLDEDQRFSEEFDTQIPLGKVMYPNGSLVETSIIEVIIKVRNIEERNYNYGMPFDIIELRLIAP